MVRTALITGVTGQDGSYLAELLLEQGYEVHGLVRRESRVDRLSHLADKPLVLHEAELTHDREVLDLIDAVRPLEVYNLAAPSFVPDSWVNPTATSDVIALGASRLLDAIRRVDTSIRFCQAGSSLMFGQAEHWPQNEQTPFIPETPYAAAKCFAYWLTCVHRQRFGLFACSAILFNHESPRRSPSFVTRKISQAAARIHLGLQRTLKLGNLEARRDWGFAGDYTRALWLMLQQETAEDYVIGTGQTHSVRQFAERAFACLQRDWREYVEVDDQLRRPWEHRPLVADSRRAREQLGWEPRVSFDQLVRMMVDYDLLQARQEDLAGETSAGPAPQSVQPPVSGSESTDDRTGERGPRDA